jgi:hypothetical protein
MSRLSLFHIPLIVSKLHRIKNLTLIMPFRFRMQSNAVKAQPASYSLKLYKQKLNPCHASFPASEQLSFQPAAEEFQAD